MVNFKTKVDKHEKDNEKRQKSIIEKEKLKLNQSQIIKQALSTGSLNNSSNKKIVFQDEDDSASGGDGDVDDTKRINGKKKPVLFDNSGSEDESFEIKEKVQFGGKKGFELLNLQSTYGNDERFKIDERFLDDEKDNQEIEEKENGENAETAEEKAQQLKILESVLGQPIITPEGEKKPKSRTFEMVRYDATNKDHEKFEVKPAPKLKTLLKKRLKERKKTLLTDREGSPKPQVSKEKFYEVSTEIKNAFKGKKEDGGFSLLQTYSRNDGDEKMEVEEKEYEEEKEEVEEVDEDYYEPSQVEEDIEMTEKVELNKDEKVEEKGKANEKVAVAKGIWKESFFFAEDDPRFKEGLEFINKKDSEEAKIAAENYDKTRKKLREILRLHMKKQQQKKDPFKNKIGGMNKKQLANSRYKNSKFGFNKRKPNKKMNPAGKI